MLNIALSVGFFIAVGVVWRLARPNGISAESLQKSIVALVLWVLLPLVVLFTMQDLPLNDRALRILLYVLGVTLIALVVAWLWLRKMNLQPKTKGAFLIAAVFGNVLFLGFPLNNAIFSGWTTRVAVEYMLVANVLLLYTVGAIFASSLAGKTSLGKSVPAVFRGYLIWLKEPVIWAALIGLGLNIGTVEMPAWTGQLGTMLYSVTIPLLLLSVGLSLNWSKSWNNQLVGVLPVVAIQLILVPLLMWGMVALFGSAGLETTKALLLDSMLPATLLGFVICERYKLDTGAYALAFTATSALALVTVPVLYNIIF
jgi:predicted permease